MKMTTLQKIGDANPKKKKIIPPIIPCRNAVRKFP